MSMTVPQEKDDICNRRRESGSHRTKPPSVNGGGSRVDLRMAKASGAGSQRLSARERLDAIRRRRCIPMRGA